MQELFWTFFMFFITGRFSTNVENLPVILPNKWWLKNRTLDVGFTEQVVVDFMVFCGVVLFGVFDPLPKMCGIMGEISGD